MKHDFGYLPEELSLCGKDWTLTTLPDLPGRIAWANNGEHVRQGWFYPGNQQWGTVGSSAITTDPFTHRVFGLPKTHQFDLRSSDDPEQVRFLIWVLSFFAGMRLTTLPKGFLDATPVNRGTLVDFHFLGSLERAIEIGRSFWQDNASRTDQTKGMIAAINALFLAQYPKHMEFEEFTWLSSALDACFAILGLRTKPPKGLGHSKRISWMCDQLGILVPEWASVAADQSSSIIAGLRNGLVHEALYASEPSGFAALRQNGPNFPLQMKNLVCRILAVILGVTDQNYLNASLTSFSRFALQA